VPSTLSVALAGVATVGATAAASGAIETPRMRRSEISRRRKDMKWTFVEVGRRGGRGNGVD